MDFGKAANRNYKSMMSWLLEKNSAVVYCSSMLLAVETQCLHLGTKARNPYTTPDLMFLKLAVEDSDIETIEKFIVSTNMSRQIK